GHVRADLLTEREAKTTDQTGIHVALGRMTNQPCRLVNHQQFSVLVDDFKQFFHKPQSAAGSTMTVPMHRRKAVANRASIALVTAQRSPIIRSSERKVEPLGSGVVAVCIRAEPFDWVVSAI